MQAFLTFLKQQITLVNQKQLPNFTFVIAKSLSINLNNFAKLKLCL
jgi:hypothetical protein